MKWTYDQVRSYADADPCVRRALAEACRSIGIGVNSAVLRAYGGQGLIFCLASPNESFPLAIKIPWYARHRSYEIANHSILSEAVIHSVASSLDCDHILPRFVGMSEAGHYLIREYVESVRLDEALLSMTYERRKQLLHDESLFARRVFKLFHESPYGCMVLRDFKPRNILLNDAGQLMLIDYGSARRETEMYSRHTTVISRHELGSGKFLYRPFEQLVETPGLLSRAVDYFAYGVLMFYTLFLRVPFSNTCSDPDLALSQYRSEYAKAKQDLVVLSTKDKDIRDWAHLIITALDIDPSSRLTSVSSLITDIS